MGAGRVVGVLGAAVLMLVGSAAPVVAAPSAQVTARGPLQLTVADGFDGRHAVEEASVRIDGVDLRIPRVKVGSAPAGSTVEVTVRTPGPKAGAALAAAVATGEATVTDARVASVAAVPNATGNHQITMVPMYWATATVPTSEPTVAELTADIAATGSYFNQVTGGQLRVSARQVLPWTKVATPPAGSCDHDWLKSEAMRLAGSMPTSPMHHLVAYFPSVGNCGWAGLASVGAGWGEPGMIWLRGSSEVWVFAHELGHNLGLYHSGGLYCTEDAVAVTLSSTCSVDAYFDPWDIMGNSPYRHVGHLSGARLAQIGVLPAGGQQIVAVGAQVRLSPITSGTGLRDVVVPIGTSEYHLEYRTPTGMDAWIDDSVSYAADGGHGRGIPGGGMVVRRVDRSLAGAAAEEFNVVNFHPLWSDDIRGLGAGEMWVSGDGGLGFRVEAADATGMTVTVIRPQDAVGPSIAATYPTAGATLGGAFSVSWSAADNGSGIEQVVVELDGTPVKEVHHRGDSMPTYTNLDNVADGAHELRVRAIDAAANEAVSAPVAITVDSVAPAVSPAPRAVLKRGTVSTSAVPVDVAWGVSDSGGICQQALTRLPGVTNWPAAAARTTPGSTAPGRATRWSLAVDDCQGNATVAAGAAAIATLDAQSRQRTGYRSRWLTSRSSSLLGGSEQVTKVIGGSFTYTTTARSLGWVASKAANRGKVAVYVDGVKITTVNLYSARTALRQQVFTRTWSKAGRHTLRLVNVSSRSRPMVGVDAMVRLS